MKTVTVFVTDFETVQLSSDATDAISSIKGKFLDRRTRQGKVVAKINASLQDLSKQAYLLGLTTSELFNHG